MKKKIHIHPLLLPLALLLSVYVNYTIDQPFWEAAWTILACLAGVCLVWFLLGRILRSPDKAAVITTILAIWAFAFGPFATALYALGEFRSLVEKVVFLLETQAGRLVLFSLWTILFSLAAMVILRSQKELRSLPAYLNILSVALLVPVLFSWNQAAHEADCSTTNACSYAQLFREQDAISLPKASPGTRPDIYYIILDGYGRQDVLADLYAYDNSPFLDNLRAMGFYIAGDSHSNYNRTIYSLPSSLNLSLFTPETVTGSDYAVNLYTLQRVIETSRLLKIMQSSGYQSLLYLSEYSHGQNQAGLLYQMPPGVLSGYRRELFTTSVVAPLLPGVLYDEHRNQISYIIDSLSGVPDDSEPTFIFAHIMAPHPPFIFTADGGKAKSGLVYGPWDAEQFISRLGKQTYLDGYTGQLDYISNKVTVMVGKILQSSPQPPIIILQGDHGPRSEGLDGELSDAAVWETTSILNAYYFPDGDYTRLYPSITPVNSFRVVLNQFFGANLSLVEDEVHTIPQ